MRHPIVTSVLVLCGVLCAACAGENEDDWDASPTTESAIVGNEVADREHPEVVQLTTPTGTCTGTLIGKRTILTARHCIDPGRGFVDGKCDVYATLDKRGMGARDSTAETFAAERCDIAPYDSSKDVTRDVATVKLPRAPKGIAPASLADDAAAEGHYEVYGYGSFGRAKVTGGKPDCEISNDGHKRKASYDGKLGFHFGQMACPGDSGGPHFIQGTSIIAGVTSRATRALLATYEENSGVAANRDWIVAQLHAYGDLP